MRFESILHDATHWCRCVVSLLCGLPFLLTATVVALLCSPLRNDALAATTAPDSAEFLQADDCRAMPQAQANSAIERAQGWAKGLKTFQAEFSQESSAAALGASEQSGGSVIFSNPGKMRWTYRYPEKQDFVITDDTMRLYQPGLKQLLIDTARIVLSSDLPVAFLSGIATVTEKFTLLRGCALLTPGRQDGSVRLELAPKVKGALAQLHLVVDTASGQVTGATILDESENVTSFSFSRIVEGRALKASQFELTVPAGTDIQDNRKK